MNARADLIQIYQYGIKNFGLARADIYYDELFDQFDIIANRPFSFPSTEHVRKDYRRCVCGVNSIYLKIVGQQIEIQAIIGRQNLDNIG